jgi:hypothetical protein
MGRAERVGIGMLLTVESLALAAVVYVPWLFAGVFGIAFLGLFGGGSVWYVLRQRRRDAGKPRANCR